MRRRTLFGTITIQLQLDEDGSIAMSYILSGESTATKVRHSRLTQETVAADVASVLAKAVPLLTPQPPTSPLQGAAPAIPAGFREVDELDPELRRQAFGAVRRMANAG